MLPPRRVREGLVFLLIMNVIIPANNEAGQVGPCLDALIASEPVVGARGRESPVRIVVAANGCTDGTVAEAEARIQAAEARGWSLQVLDLAEGSKPRALNAADTLLASEDGTGQGIRLYLDADVWVEPALLSQLAAVLDRPEPAYASGRLRVAKAETWTTRAYARAWQRVPFVTAGVTGAGLFAVNAAGRARWGAFPDIISDDSFVRLHFAPDERHEAAAGYSWPLVEGFRSLVRVRRRQDAGMAEIARLYPQLMANEGKPAFTTRRALQIALSDPIGAAVYAGVALTVRLRAGHRRGWERAARRTGQRT